MANNEKIDGRTIDDDKSGPVAPEGNGVNGEVSVAAQAAARVVGRSASSPLILTQGPDGVYRDQNGANWGRKGDGSFHISDFER